MLYCKDGHGPMALAYGEPSVRRVLRVCAKCGLVARYDRALDPEEERSEVTWNPEVSDSDRKIIPDRGS